MRHSTAPGSDDPPNFKLGECSTQRNLSAGGRAQAQAIGARLRQAGLTGVRVVSSQWCRTLDTARLLGIGAVEELPALNSLVSYPGQSAAMTADARRWILSRIRRSPRFSSPTRSTSAPSSTPTRMRAISWLCSARRPGSCVCSVPSPPIAELLPRQAADSSAVGCGFDWATSEWTCGEPVSSTPSRRASGVPLRRRRSPLQSVFRFDVERRLPPSRKASADRRSLGGGG